MKLLFVVLNKHSIVDTVSYICFMVIFWTIARLVTCVIVQFFQKHNLLALFV